MSNSFFYSILLLFAVVFGCIPYSSPEKIELKIPEHFPSPHKSPERNPLTNEGIELGRHLFYETRLSGSGEVSCASCHIQDLSFADGQTMTKLGASGQLLKRNSPALINLAWMNSFFWDGGVKNLESLPFAALTNPEEMGGNLSEIVKFLNQDEYYKASFKNAFGVDTVSSAYLARALAQFQRTLISADSKFDRVEQGLEVFTEDELRGFEIFDEKCSSCHIPPLFTDNLYHNNGLDSIFPTANENVKAGRYRITLDSSDIGKFKTPTLRNLKYTNPYMHDGRFSSLEDVMTHYEVGIIQSNTLDHHLLPISLNDNEKESLLIFLETLTDSLFTKNSQFSNPEKPDL